MKNKLDINFYRRNVLTVAQDLLGKFFVVNDPNLNKELIGKIVEVEAYDGRVDQAAHTYIGKTERNKIMFEDGGLLYVYFTYGIHYCSNIVTGKKNEGTAVLLRAMEPISGLEIFSARRFGKKTINEKEKINLLNGPAKICQAFKINKRENGIDLQSKAIYLLDNKSISKKNIVKTSRIGIKKSVELPWRFYIKDNKYVSKIK